MVSVSLLLVIALAAPETVKLPGLGDQALLLPRWAYALLYTAVFYNGWEYYLEHAAVRRLSLKFGVDAAADGIRGVMRQPLDMIAPVTAGLSALDQYVARKQSEAEGFFAELSSIDQDQYMVEHANQVRAWMIAELHNNPTDDIRARISALAGPLQTRLEDQLRAAFNVARERARVTSPRLGVVAGTLEPKIDELVAAFSPVKAAIEELTKQFNQLSDDIRREQWASFRIKDTWLPWGLFVFATLTTISEVFPPLVAAPLRWVGLL